MNTIQLECFVTVAEYLNFSKASRTLKLTQPAVTHQIQTLEKELDVKLFNRTSKNVALTQEGVLFLSDAKLILKTAFSAKERLSNHEHFLPFELGCHNYMELHLFPPVLQKLKEEFPLLRPNIHLIPFPSLLNMVENEQVHAVLGTTDGQKKFSLSFREMYQAPITCVCTPKHPLAASRSLTTEQLTGSFIACTPRQIPDSVFALQNNLLISLPPEQRYITESIESAIALVKAQIGYTLYPDLLPARDPELCYIPVTDLPEIPFGVYYAFGQEHPALKRFLSLMEDYLHQPRFAP